MKKVISLLVLLSLLLALAACVPSDGEEDGATAPATTAPSTERVGATVNGDGLSLFAIVCSETASDYARRAAEYIRDEILARTALELPVISDREPPRPHEIIVGETARELSARLEHSGPRGEFSILADGDSVALEGETFLIAAAAYFFIDTYLPCDGASAVIPTGAVSHRPITREADSFIFLIGDGMGLYQTLLFDVFDNTEEYGDGEEGFYGYYFPYQGLARTKSLSGTTDSAAAGTALASGYKTVNGYIGQDKQHAEVVSLTELFASLGKSTAVMSTEGAAGATPAAFSAHADDRSHGEDILADQAALSERCGTLISCGYNSYTREGVATLEGAITDTLDAIDDDPNGFFLVYEEAYIDKYSHSGDAAGCFRALVRFNQAIALFMEYAFYHPATAVLITADHETGGLLPSGSGSYVYNRSDHSSHYVPVFAHGDGMAVFDKRIVENVQIPKTVASLFGVSSFGDTAEYPSLIP